MTCASRHTQRPYPCKKRLVGLVGLWVHSLRRGAATRVTTIALEVNCCPCALRGIPAILCILEGGSGRRPLLFRFILCDSGPYGRHLSKGLGSLSSLGSRHRLCFIGRACCVCLDGISAGIEVDHLVCGAALRLSCLRPFWQFSLLRSSRSPLSSSALPIMMGEVGDSVA